MGLAPSLVINLPGFPFENFPSVSSIAVLRAVSSAGALSGDNYAVDGTVASGDGGGGLYAWNDFSVEADDGDFIIRPNDRSPGQAGRWVKASGSDIKTLSSDFASPENAKGAGLLGFSQTAAYSQGTAGRKFQQEVNPLDRPFLAVGSGAVDDRAAVYAADQLAPIIVTANHRISSNLTITRAIQFGARGRLTIDAGVTVTFAGSLTAPNHQIFYGDGDVAGLQLAKFMWFAGDLLNTATDALIRLQKAADAVVANGAVEHPVGYFTITGATAVNFSKGQYYYGYGSFKSEIQFTSTTANVWALTGGTSGRIEGVSTVCLNAAPPTDGDVLKITAQYVTWSDVFIRSAFRGINCDGAIGAKGTNFNVYDAMSVGVLMNNLNDAFISQFLISAPLDTLNTSTSVGTFAPGEIVTGATSGATAAVSQRISATAIKVSVNGKNFTAGETLTGGTSGAIATLNTQVTPHALGGIRLTNKVEAFAVSDGDVIGGVYPLTTDAIANTPFNRPAYNKFSNVYFDSGDIGVVIDKAVEFDFTSCWFSNRPGNGLTLITTDGMRFTGGGAINCHQNGVLVQATAKRSMFVNFAARGNSQANPGQYHGIVIAAGTTDFVVSGCTLGGSIGFGTQGYGLQVVAGASDRYSIVNNLTNSGNSSGGIQDGGTGTNKTVTGNW